MEAKDVLKRLAAFDTEDVKALPLALYGAAIGVAQYIVKPAITDLGNKLLDRTIEMIEPWEDRFFDH